MNTNRTALIIIDMQNDFVPAGGPAAAKIPAIQEVLTLYRQKELPVFHVVRNHRADGCDVEPSRRTFFLEKGGYAVPGTRGCEIVRPLLPLPEETIIVKKRFSSFMNTELDSLLRKLEVSHVTVCGVRTPTCIRTTVFDAVANDYEVTLLTDATSAGALPRRSGVLPLKKGAPPSKESPLSDGDRVAEIESANIRDIAAIGVECVTVGEFSTRFAELPETT
ncbi:MAG: cysteine hydrolase [bacterium]|nr:cysteine hydrolase [bacterium]